MRLLLTGGCGFIGSAVIRHLIRSTNHDVINVDKLTYAASPDALVVHGNRILLDADSQVSGWAQPPAFDPEVTGFVVCSETAFWRRTCVRQACFNDDLRFAMDLEFFSRLYQSGKFIKLDSFLGYFRCYRDNKSSTLSEVCQLESEREWKKIFGQDHEGWRNVPKRNKLGSVLSLIQNPCTIAFPYLYRRFVLRKRGM